MQEITEREQKLLDIIKVLINITTIWGIYEDRTHGLRDWAISSLQSAGMSHEWQNEILHTLENDFGLKYKKLNPQTMEEIEKDGSQNQDGV